jgi:hypothetical protein
MAQVVELLLCPEFKSQFYQNKNEYTVCKLTLPYFFFTGKKVQGIGKFTYTVK